MAFVLERTTQLVDLLDEAHNAGISLVASADNARYDPTHYPSGQQHVISIGGSAINYIPSESESLDQTIGRIPSLSGRQARTFQHSADMETRQLLLAHP